MSSLAVRVSPSRPATEADSELDAAWHGPPVGDRRAGPAAGAAPSQPPVIESPRMLELHGLVARVAKKPIGVLIEGETGSGKEVIAAALHGLSGRSGPLRAINCGAIPASLIESVLFGHERGAFSGALQRRLGIFEEAHRGTLLFDEIGELSPQAQAALLRVIESRRVRRIGGSGEVTVDVRIVAATHVDLERAVGQGRFRRDLLYRLNALKLVVPPLRERPEEIEPLARSFLRAARERGEARASGFSHAALDELRAYAWPGNVRELRNVVERAGALCVSPTIQPDDLGSLVQAGAIPASASLPLAEGSTIAATPANETQAPPTEHVQGDESPPSFRDQVARFEAQLIADALRGSGGGVAKAARALQLPVRTLSRKIKQRGLGAVD